MKDTEFDIFPSTPKEDVQDFYDIQQQKEEENTPKLLQPLSVLERDVVQRYVDGETPKSIAMALGISTSQIRGLLNKDHVKKVANELILDTGMALKAERVRLLNSVIEDKLSQVGEEGRPQRLADTTSKDVVDLVRAIDDILKEREKKELGSTEGSVYIQLANNLLD